MRLFVSLLLILALAPRVVAQSLQASLFQGGFTQPVYATAPPGDLTRMFVVEQGGKIKVIRNGATLATPFLNLGSGGLGKISSGGERGLLGLAFHPNFATNRYVFVNYTAAGSGATVIERYTASSANPDVALTGSGVVFLTIAQPQNNHNGGCIQFGPDGKLYIGTGDGGGAGDQGTGHATGGNAQSPASLLGKILRIDVNLPAPYIPSDNPYFGSSTTLREIWHFGMRNPWRWTFDRQTGEMYFGDVGEGAREEVSVAPAGVSNLNFGWRCMEGFNCTGLSGCTCNAASLKPAVYDYPHNVGCSVIGGYVYRGAAICGLQGTYFFGDYCTSKIWSMRVVNGQATQVMDRTHEIEPPGSTTVSIATISAFAQDAAGELYVIDYTDGEIYRIEPGSAQSDCDGDGAPDACEIASGSEQDCNANTVPDSCEIASGAAPDCNSNGVPDSCDIASGASTDVNGNGRPDECDCQGGAPPVIYCTAKMNSLGCTPSIGFSGYASASNATPFLVTASQVLNRKSGVLIYGYWANIVPFQGGLACVGAPIRRTPPQTSGGSATGTNCSGTFSFDFNAFIASSADPVLQLGAVVTCQYWSRDPASTFASSLTNAVRAQICQ